MTGIHDKRAAGESRRSKRLGRSRPEPAAAPPPPARLTTRAESSVPPPKRPHSVPAYGDRDTMDVTADPPTAPRAEAPVPPPRSAYALRNRHVPGTSNHKPYIPARNEKREELKRDRPCSSRKELEQDEPWEAPPCARAGLEYYNSMNQEDEHELVEAVDVNSFIWCGMWLHANFLARPKGASNHFPKYFFAELKLDAYGLHCASCVKIDSAESKNLGACEMCSRSIMHPACGDYHGGQTCRDPSAIGGCHGGQTRLQPAARGVEIDFSF